MEGREPERGTEPDVAFRQLFDLHFAELYRFVYRYVQSVEAAKDLVHEAFLRLWQQRDKVDLGGPTARSYLYTIARYQSLDHLRRRRVELRWQRQYSDPVMVDHGAALAADPHEEFADKETAAAIQGAVDSLPRRQREVLLLRWQRQASYEEIAQALGISPKTVAVHLSRAVQHLREMLTQVR
jgi:RNA polymerase sigma-70 factor (ECF subfamily)